MRPTFDEIYLELAHTIRKRSTCSRGKVGVVLAYHGRPISVAYNGSQPNEPHCDDIGCDVGGNNHEDGCRRTVHAESNSLIDCARRGVSTDDSVMYCTHSPCLNCAKLIIMAGVSAFYYTTPYRQREGLEYLERFIYVEAA